MRRLRRWPSAILDAAALACPEVACRSAARRRARGLEARPARALALAPHPDHRRTLGRGVAFRSLTEASTPPRRTVRCVTSEMLARSTYLALSGGWLEPSRRRSVTR